MTRFHTRAVFVTGVIIFVIVGICIWKLHERAWPHIALSPTNPISVTSTSSEEWSQFSNTTYGYYFAYPTNAELTTISEADPGPVTESAGVTVYRLDQDGAFEVVTAPDAPMLDGGTASSVNLADYTDQASLAHALWQAEKDDVNPNFNQSVSGVIDVTVASTSALSFSLHQTNSIAAIANAKKGGYPLYPFDNVVYFYILKSPSTGRLFVIDIVNNPDVSRVFSSFGFD